MQCKLCSRLSVSEELMEKFDNIPAIEKNTGVLCEISLETKTELKNHLENTHDANQSEQVVEKETTCSTDMEDLKSHIGSSEEILVESLDIVITESLNSSYDDDKFSSSIVNSVLATRHLCTVCLLSFKVKDELKEHFQKLTEESSIHRC